MFEKILQKLKTQRASGSNVTDRSLEDLAKSLVSVISTDAILETADLTNAINSIDGNINHYTAEAVKNAKKKGEEEAEAAKIAAKAEKEKKKLIAEGKEPEKVPSWAQALIDQNETLTNRIDTLHSDKTTTSRRETLLKSLVDKDGKELPEFYTAPLLASFDQSKFENEEAFETFIGTVKTNTEAFSQRVKEQGITFGAPKKDVEIPEETGETSTLSDARKVITEQKEKLEKK